MHSKNQKEQFMVDLRLTEKQMEADIAQYFARHSFDSSTRLLDVDEQQTGADKLYQ